MPQNRHISIPEAIEQIREGKMLILADDEDRENEGDLVVAAQFATPEAINTMITHGRGMVCVLINDAKAHQTDLRPVVSANTSRFHTNFTTSVDHIDTGTGISVFDRARTIQAFVEAGVGPAEFRRPGHIHPIVARPGGVLQRAGHTEGVLDLCVLAGLEPVGVLCEVLRDDGHMARMPDLDNLAEKLNLSICTVRDLIAYRLEREKLVEQVGSARLPDQYGEWRIYLYENKLNGDLHRVLIMGEPWKAESALVRVHSMCFTGDTLGSERCDCGPQLQRAKKLIAERGQGVLLYLDQEGRGIGLKAKIQAYALQDLGKDTVEANLHLGHSADPREYGIGAQILADLGLHKIEVMTNNPRKMKGLQAFGIEIVARVPLEVGLNEHNSAYMDTKKSKMGHLLELPPYKPKADEA